MLQHTVVYYFEFINYKLILLINLLIWNMDELILVKILHEVIKDEQLKYRSVQLD